MKKALISLLIAFNIFFSAIEGIDSSGKYWKYQGELFHGLPQGVGKITWEDGDSYEGEFVLVSSIEALLVIKCCSNIEHQKVVMKKTI